MKPREEVSDSTSDYSLDLGEPSLVTETGRKAKAPQTKAVTPGFSGQSLIQTCTSVSNPKIIAILTLIESILRNVLSDHAYPVVCVSESGKGDASV